jgi:hypothetical protein
MKTGLCLRTYNIDLDTDVCNPHNNADLTITLRVGFRQINPAGAAAEGTYNDYGKATGTARKTIKWTPPAWALWKTNFVISAQNYWHGKFWLVNNFPVYEFERAGKKYRPNIWCRFKLIGEDAGIGPDDHVIDVVRLHRSETWFGSHSTLYDSLDTKMVQKGTDSAGKAIMQRAHVHEIGHLLGMAHVDVGKAHCPPGSDTNAAACYGVTDTDSNSVMGQGMQLRASQANPWRKAIMQLSGKGSESVATDWGAKLVRHYPRLPEEVAANLAITRWPHR